MEHKPASEAGKDAASTYKAQIGLGLFLVYGVIYASFVIINTFDPGAMGQVVFSGLNLAVVYGFGLILLAIVMGLIYNALCTRAEDRMNPPEED